MVHIEIYVKVCLCAYKPRWTCLTGPQACVHCNMSDIYGKDEGQQIMWNLSQNKSYGGRASVETATEWKYDGLNIIASINHYPI